MPIAKGAKVRQVVPIIEGTVTERRFNESASTMEYLVSYKSSDGEQVERWFLETQIAEDKALCA